MADLTITAANVLKGANARIETGVAGATITAGQLVYKDASDSNKFKPVDSDSATAAARAVHGVSLNSVSTGHPITVQTEGEVTIGATVAVGTVYVASDTAGGIMPSADLETGDYTSIIGVGKTSAILSLSIFNSGVAVP